MSAQTTLTENAPMILDATCSYGWDRRPSRKRWPQNASVRIDIRPETKPDIVMDNTNLQFPDDYFSSCNFSGDNILNGCPMVTWEVDTQ